MTALIGLDEQVRAQAAETGGFPAIHLPLLVHGALSGDDAPAVPLAGATALVFLGADICDDLADGDMPAHWANHRPSAISLAATTLLAALPQRAIARLDAPPTTRDAMQAALAAGLLRMSAGQQDDLAMAGSANPDPQAVETSVAGKSGAEMETFAALAALLAGATPAVVASCAALGRAIGTGGQIASDCHDLFTATREQRSGERNTHAADRAPPRPPRQRGADAVRCPVGSGAHRHRRAGDGPP